jgi:penicillin-binding protein 1A
MEGPLPIAEGRAGRGSSGRPAITAAASMLRALSLAVALLAGQPGRRLRAWTARRELGAMVARAGVDPVDPATSATGSRALDRPLAEREAAERLHALTAPPWPEATLPIAQRVQGWVRGAVVRCLGPRQRATWRLAVADARLGAAAMDLGGLPGPVLAVGQHAWVAEEALGAAAEAIEAHLAEAGAAWREVLADLGVHTRTAASASAKATRTGSRAAGRAARSGSAAAGRRARAGSLAAGRAARSGSIATGRGLRTASLASARATRTGSVATWLGIRAASLALARAVRWLALAVVWAVSGAVGAVVAGTRAAVRPLGPLVRVVAAPPDRRLPAWRRFLRPVAAALVLTVLAGALAGLPAAAVLGGSVKSASAGLPDLAAMRPLAQPERSQVYDRNGKLIDVLHDEQDRIVVPLSSVPKVLQDAVIAAEDERFYHHHGIDDRGILRALVANLVQGGTVQGGSTITQQLVRNAYPDLKDRSVVRKVKEASLASQLEDRMSKAQILEAYLNRVYFGAGYYGVEAASRGYFGKHAADLSVAQAATLAGVIREPERANPRGAPARAAQRRDTVLQQMAKLSMITPAAAANAEAAPMKVQPPRESGENYPWFMDALKRQLLADPRLGNSVAERNRELYEGGLRIDTTLDPTMQSQAEQAAANWRPASGPDVAIVSIDPRSGGVRALVGGRNFEKRKYNLAVQAERQAGSSFKPFVLAAALNDGISPDSLWESSGFSATVCGRPWSVSNYEGGGSGRITLRDATARSVNGVYARVMAQLCPAKVVSMAQRLGVSVLGSQAHEPSIALGTANVTPIEMASAYATFADLGVYHQPVLFTRISHHGKTLFESSTKGEQRISPQLAYEVTNVLEGVVQGGTGTAASLGRPVAGKTGTTQDYRDAWFVGYTPQLSTAVWMGNPEQEVPMTDVGGIRVTGGSYPARIWHDFMAAALAGRPSLDWRRPDGGPEFAVVTGGQRQGGNQQRRVRRPPRQRPPGRHGGGGQG